MTDFRVALVGLGTAGQTLHLPALAEIGEATVVGVCDLDERRRAEVARRWKVPVFDDFDGMLETTAADVVVIGTPPATHADYCLRSLAGGAHVICEKPFVGSLEEADQVIEAAARAGRRVALNHEFRQMPIFNALRTEVERLSEEVIFVQVWQLMDLPPWSEPGWRGQMVQRTLYEAGVHLVDYVMWLFGELPRSVQATTSTCGVRQGETDAVAVVTFEFSRGRLATITQNRLCKGETHYFEARAETRTTSLRASFGGRARVTAGLYRSTRPQIGVEYGVSGIAWKETGPRRTLLARNPRDPGSYATRVLFSKTLAALRDGSPLPTTAEDGRDVLEVIFACYESALSGNRVLLDKPIDSRYVGEQVQIKSG